MMRDDKTAWVADASTLISRLEGLQGKKNPRTDPVERFNPEHLANRIAYLKSKRTRFQAEVAVRAAPR